MISVLLRDEPQCIAAPPVSRQTAPGTSRMEACARQETQMNFKNNESLKENNMATVGSKTMTEFCEQVNPRILLEMRRTCPLSEAPKETRRVQDSWSAAAEKRALVWMAARTPSSQYRFQQASA